jgi:uncharacterized membrane protein YfcA
VDPLLIVFGLGVGILVGMTGMGGGSLMTPLLVLLFGFKPTVAVGSDIAYQAITKSVGGWRHLRLSTVNLGVAKWLAFGSVPGAVGGVYVIKALERAWGSDVEAFTLIALGAVLAFTGGFTLIRCLLAGPPPEDGDDRHVDLTSLSKALAVLVGVTTGFVIGITSAGSGTMIAVALLALFHMSPRHVVGTDVFHAAILLWAAGLAHWAGGNIDWALVGMLLIGSVPGVMIGARFSVKVPIAALRTALGAVLVLSGAATLQKAEVAFVPGALIAALVGLLVFVAAGVLAGKLRNPWVTRPPATRVAAHAAGTQ